MSICNTAVAGVCVYAHRYFELGEASVECTLDLATEMNDVRCCKPHYSHSCSRVSLPTFILQGDHLTHLHLQRANKIHFKILLQSAWLPPWVNISSFMNSKKNNTFWAAAKIRTAEESDICFMFISGGVKQWQIFCHFTQVSYPGLWDEKSVAPSKAV